MADKQLTVHSDTYEYILKLYDLDKEGRLDESIDILVDWINKQEHFVRKDYSRDYLKRVLLLNKGSVEKTKTRIDKLCTLRTHIPKMFADYDFKTDFAELDVVQSATMPTLTEDHYRVFIMKVAAKKLSSSFFTNYYRFFTLVIEYLTAHTYFNGLIAIADYREVNMSEILTSINPVELQHILTLLMEGYGVRLQGIHLITSSKLVDVLVGLLKQCLSEKLGSRIHVHTTPDTLKNFMPLESLPSDYGGKDKSLDELHADLQSVIDTDKHKAYIKMLNEFRTDESLRLKDRFNEQYMGMPGSFRTLSVD